MKKIILALAFSASLTGFAEAQTSRNPCYTTGAQTTQGIPNCISVGTSTPLPVVTTTTTGAPLDVEGNVASGTADSGNPVKIGGKYNATLPTLVDGQRGDAQLSIRGNLRTQWTASSISPADAVSNTNLVGGPNFDTSQGGALYIGVAPSLFNGTNWDRFRSINGTLAAGTGTQAVAIAPTSSAAGAIKPIVTSAPASSLVLKASAGNLYSVTVTSASAGLLMIFDATSAPVNGPVTPVECIAVAANSTAVVNFSPGPPSSYTTGITAVFSSGSDCFTKAAVTAFISGKVQ